MELSVVARCPHQNLCQKCFHFLVSANSKKASWRCENETSVLLKTYFQFTNKNRFELSRWRFLLPVVDLPEYWPLLDAKWLLGEMQIRLQERMPQQEVTSRKVIGLNPSSTKGFIFAKFQFKGTSMILLSGKFWVHVWNMIILCVCKSDVPHICL